MMDCGQAQFSVDLAEIDRKAVGSEVKCHLVHVQVWFCPLALCLVLHTNCEPFLQILCGCYQLSGKYLHTFMNYSFRSFSNATIEGYIWSVEFPDCL